MNFNVTELIGLWFKLFFKPEETANRLKERKPCLSDGAVSIGLCSAFLGSIAFLLTLIFSVLALIGGSVEGAIISMAISFAIFVIGIPIIAMILLIISTTFLKIASILLKGKGSFSNECGVLGIVGSSMIILYLTMFLIIFIAFFLLGILIGITGGFVLGTGLTYIILGAILLVFSPLTYLLIAILFDLLADIEQVSIYRSGMIVGLMQGIATFLIYAIFGVIMMFLGSASTFMMGGL